MPVPTPPRPARRARERVDAFVLRSAPDAVRDRLAALPRGRFRVVEAHADRAVLMRRVHWATWGDRFELDWSAASGGTAVRVTASKRFPTALGDYGQGARDLRVLVRLLAGHPEH